MSGVPVAPSQVQTILEFDKIVHVTAGLCLTPMGPERLTEWVPTADITVLDKRRAEAAEMLTVLRASGNFPIARVPDIRPHLEKSGLEGSFIESQALLEIGEFLSAVEGLLGFAPRDSSAGAFPLLESYLEGLSGVYPLRSAVERSITPEGDVSDQASPELARLRREKRSARDAIVVRLERILAKRQSDPGRTDDIVTLRNDRFVIPMREGDPAANEGVIQDRSSSGATLFVEPMAVVELNNRLRRIGLEESREVERILREITDLVRTHRYALSDDVGIVGALDAIHAVARFGVMTDGAVAERLDTAELNLIEARHPLLILKSRGQTAKENTSAVVPMSVNLGNATTAIIITGPNTGGKTVALKTVGLLVLMAQAGWPLPAKPLSQVGVFGRVFADIGDEQSIESSLSTFSSHLSRINAALSEADDRSLVLFDELGAGTDPKEGAALGEAIVSEFTGRGVRLVVTTHHTALKTLAQHDQRIENAAVLFDPKTLSPTYQFRLGLPGASYAIDIARRLGLPDRVTQHADSLLDQQEKDLSRLLLELDERLAAVRDSQAETEKRQHAAEALEDLFRARMAKLEQMESKRKSEALAQAETIVTSTRQEMERLVREIRETQAEKQRVKESHHVIDERLREIREQKAEVTPPAPSRDSEPLKVGDHVWIDAFHREGEIVSIDGKREQIKVQIGDFFYSLDRSAAERMAADGAADHGDATRVLRSPSGGFTGLTSDAGPEISLRGLSAEDALEMLDRYLDEALLAGWHEVRIIHGKGEGILRRAVGEFLAKDKRVAAKRPGQWNEGAEGVTIAALRVENA